MIKLLIILLIGLVFEAIGVVLLSQGLKQIGPFNRVTAPEIVRIIKRGAANGRILLGVFFEALFFASLLVLMSRSDVSFVWPLTSLGFVLTTLAAHLILKEQVSALRWCGVCLIMLGAGLITWTEQQRSHDPHPVSEGRASRGPDRGRWLSRAGSSPAASSLQAGFMAAMRPEEKKPGFPRSAFGVCRRLGHAKSDA